MEREERRPSMPQLPATAEHHLPFRGSHHASYLGKCGTEERRPGIATSSHGKKSSLSILGVEGEAVYDDGRPSDTLAIVTRTLRCAGPEEMRQEGGMQDGTGDCAQQFAQPGRSVSAAKAQTAPSCLEAPLLAPCQRGRGRSRRLPERASTRILEPTADGIELTSRR